MDVVEHENIFVSDSFDELCKMSRASFVFLPGTLKCAGRSELALGILEAGGAFES